MTNLKDLSIYISNYKCFGNDLFGYETILPVNLIIGRNNSGKSTLLDLIEYLTAPKDLSHLGHKGQPPRATVSGLLTETELRQVFSEHASGGPLYGNHWNFGKDWIGKRISWEIKPQGYDFVATDPPFGQSNLSDYETQLARLKANPFKGFSFKRLLADRDISAEEDAARPAVRSNGQGFTNVIQHFINKASLPSSLVEGVLLNELNAIFEPDGTFTDIVVQQLEHGHWEVYLEEVEKGRVPLSHTGSGLKTILLVLAFLHLVPRLEGKELSRYLFGFEELENNLHPALQRRLLLYLRDMAVEHECMFFLTTHSNVAIDLFANDDQAQILHVTHDRKCASVKRVTTYVENRGILDDLDVRASDLLQANGIVWVEGPSDRLYFNRWIDLWSDGKIKEGAHYQCVFYGGRLLAHLSANDPDVDTNEVIKILRVNRNAILIIDSDRRKQADSINTTKQRLIDEIVNFGGMAWVTAGKEIENYIPKQALFLLYERSEQLTPLRRYQDIAGYLDSIKAKEGTRFLRNKVLFAERVAPHITKDDMVGTLDLHIQTEAAYRLICKWNGLDIGNV